MRFFAPAVLTMTLTIGPLAYATPTVDKPAGYYQSPMTVTVTGATSASPVHYTLDGSEPTASNGETEEQTFEVAIDQTRVLRVRQGIGPITTRTFILPSKLYLQDKPQEADPDLPATYFGINQSVYATLDGSPGISAGDHTAFIIQMVRIPSISIACPNIWGDNDQILSRWQNTDPANGPTGWWNGTKNVETTAVFEWMEPDPVAWSGPLNNYHQQETDLSHHGEFVTLGVDKQSLLLKFRNGDLEPAFNVYDTGSLNKFDEIVLRNGNWDSFMLDPSSVEAGYLTPTYGRTAFAAKLMIALGNEVHPRVRPVNVFINGLYWGLYWFTEKPNRKFMENHFDPGFEKEDFFTLNEGVQPDDPFELAAYEDAWFGPGNVGALRQTNFSATGNLDGIEDLVDLDNYIDFLIVSAIMQTGDAFPIRQYRVAGSVPPDAAQIVFFSWDQDVSMRWDTNAFDATSAYGISIAQSRDLTRIAHNMKNDSAFKQRFGARLIHHFWDSNGFLTHDNVKQLWDEQRLQLESVILPEYARWGHLNGSDPSDLQRFNSANSEVSNLNYFYFRVRLELLFEDFVDYFSLIDTTDVNGNGNDTEPLPTPSF